MKLSNNYNLSLFSNKNLTSFKKESLNKSFVKKMLPKTMYVLLPLSILCTMCSKTENRVTEKTSFNNSNVEYFNVKESTKEAVQNSLENLKSKAKTIDFLDEVNIDVTKNFKNLDTKEAFRCALKERPNSESTGGISFYSDKNIARKICLQEDAHKQSRIHKEAQASAIKSTLMHEIGHQFDDFYGHNHESTIAKNWNEVQVKRAQEDSLSVYSNPTDVKDFQVKLDYIRQNGLSDKKEFKEAYYKDLQKIHEIQTSGNGKLAEKLFYFVPRVESLNEITLERVDGLDARRSETYAELFSYAVGEDNGDKEAFLSNFSNSYKIVKRDIEKYLGIK